jgi:hypothetical protein
VPGTSVPAAFTNTSTLPNASTVRLQFFEALYAQNMRRLTIAQAEHHKKRLDRAHGRHLSAIRALAQMRKLLKGASIT